MDPLRPLRSGRVTGGHGRHQRATLDDGVERLSLDDSAAGGEGHVGGSSAEVVVADEGSGSMVQLVARGLDPHTTHALWLTPPGGIAVDTELPHSASCDLETCEGTRSAAPRPPGTCLRPEP